MTEARPLTAEEIAALPKWRSQAKRGTWFIGRSGRDRLIATIEAQAAHIAIDDGIKKHLRGQIDQRDEQIKRLRKLLIERGAASVALASTEPPK